MILPAIGGGTEVKAWLQATEACLSTHTMTRELPFAVEEDIILQDTPESHPVTALPTMASVSSLFSN
jgi:hypothetical protein